ncbi:MAG TPA: NmrA family NAD(P)-binding protein [Candidatus Acidoferrum sp.]|nr:NmrA family NAD(P)-binding protein [Candidatus Acidoferrum sp.]
MYVILGATGHTGSVVANSLLSKKKKVRVVGRDNKKLAAFTSRGAEAFTANVTDEKTLSRAFTGAEAAYVMIPPDLTNDNYRGYQSQVSSAIAKALENAGVKHAVTLSSVGADKPDKTGPIVGLREMETKLNAVKGLDVLHLRAGYFMENTLPQVGVIRTIGTMSGPVDADVPLAMIATRDIGVAAAEALLKLDFKGKQTQELHGQRDLTYAEAAIVIGKAIGKPELDYARLPDDQVVQALSSMGMAKNVAELILEMANAINRRHVKTLEPRSAKNTTPTSYEAFVQEMFLPAYKGQAAGA